MCSDDYRPLLNHRLFSRLILSKQQSVKYKRLKSARLFSDPLLTVKLRTNLSTAL